LNYILKLYQNNHYIETYKYNKKYYKIKIIINYMLIESHLFLIEYMLILSHVNTTIWQPHVWRWGGKKTMTWQWLYFKMILLKLKSELENGFHSQSQFLIWQSNNYIWQSNNYVM